MLDVFLLGIFFRRATTLGAIVGALVGFAIVCYVAFWTDTSFFWYGCIGCFATVGVGYAVSGFGGKPADLPDQLFFAGIRSKESGESV